MAPEEVKNRALFITIEGLEGSGKTSVINYLETKLKNSHFKLAVFREPGSTTVGEKIRKILLDKNNDRLSQHTELLLYLAARTQLIEEKLTISFKNNDIVLCDRFYDSTVVYQGYGLGLEAITRKAVSLFNLGVVPDLTIFLDSDPGKSLKRLGVNKDRIESRPLDFHQRLQAGFKILARQNPERIKTVNSDRDLEIIYKDIDKIIEHLLWQKKKIRL